jgi:hypothetical protein
MLRKLLDKLNRSDALFLLMSLIVGLLVMLVAVAVHSTE